MFISLSRADNCVVIKDVGPVLVRNVLLLKEKYYVVCESFTQLSDLFFHPLPSSHIGIVKATESCGKLVVISVDDILFKCVCLPFDRNVAVLPLIH